MSCGCGPLRIHVRHVNAINTVSTIHLIHLVYGLYFRHPRPAARSTDLSRSLTTSYTLSQKTRLAELRATLQQDARPRQVRQVVDDFGRDELVCLCVKSFWILSLFFLHFTSRSALKLVKML